MQMREVDTNPKKGLHLCSTLCHEVGPLVGGILLLALELPWFKQHFVWHCWNINGYEGWKEKGWGKGGWKDRNNFGGKGKVRLEWVNVEKEKVKTNEMMEARERQWEMVCVCLCEQSNWVRQNCTCFKPFFFTL